MCQTLILTLIYFLTRLPFLRSYPVYYDSFEYVRIAKTITFSNFLPTIALSHQPIHTLYFAVVIIFKNILFFASAETVLVIVSLVFGYWSLLVWYLTVKKHFKWKRAFLPPVIMMFFPYFFIITTNIFYEPLLAFFLILSFYLVHEGMKKKSYGLIISAAVAFGMSVSVFIGTIFFLPVIVLPLVFKRHYFRLILFTTLSLTAPFLLDLALLKDFSFVAEKYSSHLSDVVSTKGGLLILTGRMIRNFVIQLSSILSWPGLVFFFISLVSSCLSAIRKNLVFVFWLIPIFILTQYWHAGLFGRLSLTIIFPASALISLILKKKALTIIFLSALILTVLPYGLKQKEIPPIYRYYQLIKNVPNPAVVTSDYNRFVYQINNMNIFFLNSNHEDVNQIREFINKNLKEKRKVLIDSSALRYPYYQYDGDFFHILSQKKVNETLMSEALKNYHYQKYLVDDTDYHIYFLEVTAN